MSLVWSLTCEKSNQAVPLVSAEHKKSFLNNYLRTRPESIFIYHCFLSGNAQEETFPNRESLMILPQTKKISWNIFAASLMVKGWRTNQLAPMLYKADHLLLRYRLYELIRYMLLRFLRLLQTSYIKMAYAFIFWFSFERKFNLCW